MKSLEVDLPERIASELDKLVQAGFYFSAQEAVRHAIADFLRQQSSALAEKHQLEDIAWAYSRHFSARPYGSLLAFDSRLEKHWD